MPSASAATAQQGTGERRAWDGPSGLQGAVEKRQAHVHPVVDRRMRVVELLVPVRGCRARRAGATGCARRSADDTGRASRNRRRCPRASAGCPRRCRRDGSDRACATAPTVAAGARPSRGRRAAGSPRAPSDRRRRWRPSRVSISACASASFSFSFVHTCSRKRRTRPSSAPSRGRLGARAAGPACGAACGSGRARSASAASRAGSRTRSTRRPSGRRWRPSSARTSSRGSIAPYPPDDLPKQPR